MERNLEILREKASKAISKIWRTEFMRFWVSSARNTPTMSEKWRMSVRSPIE